MRSNYWSPRALEPLLPNKRSHGKWEGCALQLESSPPFRKLETSLRSNKDPAWSKTNQFKKKLQESRSSFFTTTAAGSSFTAPVTRYSLPRMSRWTVWLLSKTNIWANPRKAQQNSKIPCVLRWSFTDLLIHTSHKCVHIHFLQFLLCKKSIIRIKMFTLVLLTTVKKCKII